MIQPGQIYQHYLGGLVIVQGVSIFKDVEEDLDCPLYSIASPEFSEELNFLLSLDQKLNHYNPIANELIIYNDLQKLQYCTMSYFDVLMGKPHSTNYRRFNLIAGCDGAQNIYQLVERYNATMENLS